MPGGIRRRKLAKSGLNNNIKRRARKERKKKLIYGNSIVEQNWNPKLTVAQNYRQLGLASGLQRATGGVEDPKDHSNEIKVRSKPVPTAKIITAEDGSVKVEYVPVEEEDIDAPFEPVEGRTEVVKQLEEMARSRKQTVRHQSQEEVAWLQKLVAKHGDNFEAMQWDRKLNQFQHSAGELKRRIKRLNSIY